MTTCQNIVAVLLVQIFITVVHGGFFTPGEDDPAFIKTECLRHNCTEPLCYIPHPNNCLKFIMCRPTPRAVIAQVMPCAFGTRWKARGQGVGPTLDGACDRHDLVVCSNEPCRNTSRRSFKHRDSNCRTFWRCDGSVSVPACCPQYHSYNPATDNCELDRTCRSPCPLEMDATCNMTGVKSINFADGNCKTYWECGRPHPVCCPAGEGYDVITSTCSPDPSCVDACPADSGDNCVNGGIESHDIDDGNCRTYMQCNQNGLDTPSCCLPGKMYDNSTRSCVNARGPSTCALANCPLGFKDPCRLEAVPGRPNMYKNLDAFGGTIMPCAIPLVFNAQACQCILDPFQSTPPPGCSVAIHAKPPALRNFGSAVAALLMIGDYGQGEKAFGNMSSFWDGNDGIVIPYYGSQWLREFYLEIIFRPIASSGKKQIVLSSCSYRDKLPTLELSLMRHGNKSGTFTLKASNSDLSTSVQIDTPYTTGQDYKYRVIYDNKRIGVLVDTIPSTGAVQRIEALTGLIPIHISGLRFAHCRYERNMSSFVGYVSEIKFSKCVTPEMSSELYPVLP